VKLDKYWGIIRVTNARRKVGERAEGILWHGIAQPRIDMDRLAARRMSLRKAREPKKGHGIEGLNSAS